MFYNKKETPIKYEKDIIILFIYTIFINTLSINIYSYLLSIFLVCSYIIFKFKENYDYSLLYILIILVLSTIYLSYYSCFYSIKENIKNNSELIDSKIEILSNKDYELTINKELIKGDYIIKKFNLNNQEDFKLFYEILNKKPILIVHKASYFVYYYYEIQNIIEIKEF